MIKKAKEASSVTLLLPTLFFYFLSHHNFGEPDVSMRSYRPEWFWRNRYPTGNNQFIEPS